MSNTKWTLPAAARLGEVEEYYFSQKLREIAQMRAAGKEVLNLGIGSPDLPPHPKVVDALSYAASHPDNHAYQGYRGIAELRQAFGAWYARYYGVTMDSENEILPLMGSKEGIMHIAMGFLNPGDKVLVPNPGYPAYAAASKMAGADIQYYDLQAKNGWLPDWEALAQMDLSQTKLMWLNYPNMPTGRRANPAFFRQMIDWAKQHQIVLVNDNPYSFIMNDEPLSILAIEGAKEVALELNSLSKSHNMAGWRLGVLLGRKEYVDTVIRFKSNMDSGMFRPLQLAAVEALQLGTDWYAQNNSIYTERQRLAYRLMASIGCVCQPDQGGMFVWGKIPAHYKDAYALSNQLLYQKNIFITPGGIFGSNGNQYVRISLCQSKAVFQEAQKRIENG